MQKTSEKRSTRRVSQIGSDDEEMPSQSQGTRQRRLADDDEEFEDTQTQTQTQTQKQAQKSVDQLNSAEFNRKVADLVRYLLFADKKKVPIKRQDITKNVMKEHSKAFPKVMEAARKQLQKVFGFEVVEVESGKSKMYVLVNLLKYEADENSFLWEQDSAKAGLLMIILSLIFMNEGSLNEATLWHTMKKLGIEKDKQHKAFGDPDKLINQDFTKQMYLDRTKSAGAEGPTFQYYWGLRAKEETNKRKVLSFVSEMYNVNIESWKSQYREILDEEQAGPSNESSPTGGIR